MTNQPATRTPLPSTPPDVINCGPAEFAGGPDVVARSGRGTIYTTPLETALARTFTADELAELAHGLADVPALIRGAGGLAARPLAVPDGPLARLLCAVRAASGYAPAPATTRGVIPVGKAARRRIAAASALIVPGVTA